MKSESVCSSRAKVVVHDVHGRKRCVQNTLTFEPIHENDPFVYRRRLDPIVPLSFRASQSSTVVIGVARGSKAQPAPRNRSDGTFHNESIGVLQNGFLEVLQVACGEAHSLPAGPDQEGTAPGRKGKVNSLGAVPVLHHGDRLGPFGGRIITTTIITHGGLQEQSANGLDADVFELVDPGPGATNHTIKQPCVRIIIVIIIIIFFFFLLLPLNRRIGRSNGSQLGAQIRDGSVIGGQSKPGLEPIDEPWWIARAVPGEKEAPKGSRLEELVALHRVGKVFQTGEVRAVPGALVVVAKEFGVAVGSNEQRSGVLEQRLVVVVVVFLFLLLAH
mmetsp:Transcript_29048/g.78614  ORF Transcript_29048/g.78614 Transcript_29048/m.78614 type:complete len:331 (-) Transcript_29048:411-1403(-)